MSKRQARPLSGSANMLETTGLKVTFPVQQGFLKKPLALKAVDGVTMHLGLGEAVGVVGESGCGKSTLLRALLGLVPVQDGMVLLDGLPQQEWRGSAGKLCKSKLQAIFQDPAASLDPRQTIRESLLEPLAVHGQRGKPAHDRMIRVLQQVGLGPESLGRYPHEFSGGQCQRIAIARALILQPRYLLCDEAVSALDVSVKAQIVNLLLHLHRVMHLSLLFVSHDLMVVRHISSRIIVMYLGRVVEEGRTEDIFQKAAHPYTRALLDAILQPDPQRERARKPLLLAGEIPSPLAPPPGCSFHPRCPWGQGEARCREEKPPLRLGPSETTVACHLAEQVVLGKPPQA
jgi:oligopeptide/dipeptide ABC transporter ATP-binding protein